MPRPKLHQPAWPYDRDRTADALTSEAAATPYLHRLAQQGCCGLVSYKETPQGSTMNGLAQVLLQGQQSESSSSSRLQVRYNHMQACFMSTSESASLIAVEAGMTILPLLSNSTSKARNSDRLFGWPQSSDMAQRAMEVLGKMPAFHQSVLLVLLLTNSHNSDLQRFQANQSADVCFAMDGFPKVARPLQSHRISNMMAVSQCLAKSSLMVQHLPGVVRCDNVRSLSLTDIMKHGGGCCILAEHILPELAYKLGRAAKYGA
ncbi:hypothetical protein WJX79_011012 [Trebouxia sp. C0005]